MRERPGREEAEAEGANKAVASGIRLACGGIDLEIHLGQIDDEAVGMLGQHGGDRDLGAEIDDEPRDITRSG